jgi:hypothetical protein
MICSVLPLMFPQQCNGGRTQRYLRCLCIHGVLPLFSSKVSNISNIPLCAKPPLGYQSFLVLTIGCMFLASDVCIVGDMSVYIFTWHLTKNFSNWRIPMKLVATPYKRGINSPPINGPCYSKQEEVLSQPLPSSLYAATAIYRHRCMSLLA